MMMERFRVMSGLPQKTKMRIATRPTKAYKAIWYLVNMRNYFRDIEVGGRFTLYYDEQTKRSGKEDYYTKSCGLTFEQVQSLFFIYYLPAIKTKPTRTACGCESRPFLEIFVLIT